jgi:hypothetical protein
MGRSGIGDRGIREAFAATFESGLLVEEECVVPSLGLVLSR